VSGRGLRQERRCRRTLGFGRRWAFAPWQASVQVDGNGARLGRGWRACEGPEAGPPASWNRCHGSVGLEGQGARRCGGRGRAIRAQFVLVRLYAGAHFSRLVQVQSIGSAGLFVCNLSRLKKVPINPSTGSLCLFGIGKHVFFSMFYYQILQPFLGVAGTPGAHDPWLSIEHRHIFEGTIVPLRTTPPHGVLDPPGESFPVKRSRFACGSMGIGKVQRSSASDLPPFLRTIRSRPRLRPHAARRLASGDRRPGRSDGVPAASGNGRQGSARQR
jgi:hypothetical protein